jgi:hypothetical protein
MVEAGERGEEIKESFSDAFHDLYCDIVACVNN